MAKKTEKIKKRIEKKVTKIKEQESRDGSSMTHARVCYDNLRILESLRDQAEISYELEMEVLGIKKLTIDDAMTLAMWEGREKLSIGAQEFDENSRMMKLINYRKLV